MTATRYYDRHDAGRQLARRLDEYAGRRDVLVLALPRGGVPVAVEVARELEAPLDVFLVRKLGLPGHEEYAMGAIASGGVQVLNEEVVRHFGISDERVAAVVVEERGELERRARLYRDDRPAPELRGRTLIVVDDGLATGATMRAAVQALRTRDPASIVVAVPVASRDACEELGDEADGIVCAMTPEPFQAVGLWYDDFSQTTDEEVRRLLAQSSARHPSADDVAARTAARRARTVHAFSGGPHAVHVAVNAHTVLDGDLTVPEHARGLVLFAHGSGSSRHSSRNQRVAASLVRAGFATLLFDLLTVQEEEAERHTRHLRFDIPLLAGRLLAASEWARAQRALHALPQGYFGASTGGGAALVAAARRPDLVSAVVSRGGRPDLAGDALPGVSAPTLLLVGERDPEVLELNRAAAARMTAVRELVVIPGATHLFEEPGALEQVASYAEEWFERQL